MRIGVLRGCPSCVADIVRRALQTERDDSVHGPTLRASQERNMSKLLRGLAAGYGAKKLGGGCFSTVLIFILLWWLLGHFGVFR
jgi:hypothetical protein